MTNKPIKLSRHMADIPETSFQNYTLDLLLRTLDCPKATARSHQQMALLASRALRRDIPAGTPPHLIKEMITGTRDMIATLKSPHYWAAQDNEPLKALAAIRQIHNQNTRPSARTAKTVLSTAMGCFPDIDGLESKKGISPKLAYIADALTDHFDRT